MFDYLQFEGNQKVDLSDFTRIAQLPRDALDRYMLDLVGFGGWYSGCKCVDKGSGQLNIGAGTNNEIYVNGVGYYDDTVGGFQMNMLDLAPTVSFKWVAILGRGETQDEDIEPTTYLTNSTSRATTGKYKPRLKIRKLIYDRYQGTAGADPQMPRASEIPSGNVIIAYVKLSPAGIVSVVMNALALMPTLGEARRRMDDFDAYRASTGGALDALQGNVSAIQDRLAGLLTATFGYELARDLGGVKQQLKIPQIFSSYGTDHYLDEQYSDVNNPDYLATIEEGIRFPPAAQSDSQLGLLNIYDGSVVTIAGMIFPKFHEVIGLSNQAHDTTVLANAYQYQTLNIQTLYMTRQRVRVGGWFGTCTNWFWYIMGGGSYNPASRIFTLYNGDTFEVDPDYAAAAAGIGTLATSQHLPVRIRQVWFDTETVPYSVVNYDTVTVQGIVQGNTFLCDRDGWLPAINLYFSDKAASGDVEVLLLQVPTNGIPDNTKVIGRTTVRVADIKVSTSANKVPTRASFAPLVAMQKGQRYAFVVITSGGHSLWQSTANKVANGSYFANTDGAWNQPDLEKDLNFDLVWAEFDYTQVAVQLQPLTLNGGIATIDVLAQAYAPNGTSLDYQVQVNGVYRSILDFQGDTSPLAGLPPLLPFRVVMSGSTSMMPGLGVAANSRVSCFRPRSDFRHISDIKTLPAGVQANMITTTHRLEWWRGVGHHTHGAKIRYGANYATQLSPNVVKDTPAPDDPTGTILRKSVFVLPAPITTFQIEQDGTTDNVVATFHVAEGDHVAQMQ